MVPTFAAPAGNTVPLSSMQFEKYWHLSSKSPFCPSPLASSQLIIPFISELLLCVLCLASLSTCCGPAKMPVNVTSNTVSATTSEWTTAPSWMYSVFSFRSPKDAECVIPSTNISCGSEDVGKSVPDCTSVLCFRMSPHTLISDPKVSRIWAPASLGVASTVISRKSLSPPVTKASSLV